MAPVSIDDVREARDRIQGVAVRTPLHRFMGASLPGDNELWLKLENLQRTGAFKFRGAYNAVSSLSAEERARGVITYSSGNHGQAVACAAFLLGIKSVIVMPEDAIPLKVEATRRWGAEVSFAGHTSIDRHDRAMELVAEHGYTVIPPFDDRRIIAGQGTAGLEIAEQMPDVRTVVVQVGGGGLVSGVATAIKALKPNVNVIGVEPEGGADARDSLQRGEIVAWKHIDTVADGLRTSKIGELNFATISELVDEIVTVSDDEVLRAVGILANEAKIVVEPSGAVAPAAVLFGHVPIDGGTMVAMCSGGNIDPARLADCVRLSSRAEVPAVPA